MIRVGCLVCTNRPEWESWWRHQISKQIPYPDAEYIYMAATHHTDSIASKRQHLLEWAKSEQCDYVAWFDDDDWSPLGRIGGALSWFRENPLDAVGAASSYFVDSRPAELKSSRCVRYRAPEGIIFNGAVFKNDLLPDFNQALTVGEDTAWLGAWLEHNPNYIILGGDMHLWLCHAKNTTNRATERSFDERLKRGLITEEEWKLVPR